MADQTDQTDTVAVRIAWDPLIPGNAGKVERLPAAEARRLVRDGRAAYITDAPPADRRTPEEILTDVGDDAAKAQAALDAEQAQARPRKTLVTRLTALTEVNVDPAAFGGQRQADDGAPQTS
jgi:hypothetical protein